jgi:hypothetical protein
LANAEKPHRERSITAKQVARASMNIISESGPKKMLKPSEEKQSLNIHHIMALQAQKKAPSSMLKSIVFLRRTKLTQSPK